MDFNIWLINTFGLNTIIWTNILGACLSYGVATLQCFRKKDLGYKYALPIIIVIIVMAAWMLETSKTLLLSSAIQLLIAITLPELVACIKNRSYSISLATSVWMLALSILGWNIVLPLWRAQEAANLATVLMMLLCTTTVVSVFCCFMNVTAILEADKKTKAKRKRKK